MQVEKGKEKNGPEGSERKGITRDGREKKDQSGRREAAVKEVKADENTLGD